MVNEPCRRCNSQRLAHVNAKCSDLCFVTMGSDVEHDGYVPGDMGIGGGDYVEFTWCLDCGTIQDEFPMAETAVEKGESF